MMLQSCIHNKTTDFLFKPHRFAFTYMAKLVAISLQKPNYPNLGMPVASSSRHV